MQPTHIPAKRNPKGWRIAVSVISTLAFVFFSHVASAQNCATSGADNVSSNDNTYYPGVTASLSPGATAIQVGAAGSGSYNIKVGDILLIIQMQGAQIKVPTTGSNPQANTGYGNNTGTGRGFLTTNLLAGNMEFIIATNAISRTTGGTLSIASGLVNTYKNSAFGTDGQYTYQLILIQPHYNIKLTGNIAAPLWNGSTGGVVVLSATNQIDFNGETISAKGTGFRGGGGKKLGGQSGAGGNDWKFYYTMSPNTYKANGAKGEGIAGTSKYLNNNGSLLTGSVEGYPNGSFARGAPGNAGGGATDSDPAQNDQNAGGGGGGNGGIGGVGGNGWSSALTSGGVGGDKFTTYAGPGRLIMGGGGGAGSTNDGTGNAANDGFMSSGASGGGIVLVNALTIVGTGTIDVSGNDASDAPVIDGSGGGGAAGSILIYAGSGQSGITAIADGGDGGDNHPANSSATDHGPGGGGGGGIVYSNNALNAASSANGGANGISYGTAGATSNYGAGAGGAGVIHSTAPYAQIPPNMQICQIHVLPATITDFYATYIASNNVKLSWSTTDEINAAYYEVERSTNASDFTAIGEVSADQSGASVHNYTANDQLAGVSSNIVYYRLRIVDESGKFVYSKVVPVKLDLPETSFSVYPNPVDSYTILNLLSNKQTTGTLRLIDNSGRQILTRTITVNNGANSIMLDQLGNLPRGLYIVQALVDNNLYNQKLLKK
ncbi:MAG TPA: T9SS type A sorting domain-containing protein [Puia sp.]|nr:T9SS type A sorting domain-containing protein [Puia sp.]